MKNNLEISFNLDPYSTFDQNPEWVFQKHPEWVFLNRLEWIQQNKPKEIEIKLLYDYMFKHHEIVICSDTHIGDNFNER